jgi:hypothetical protein
MMTHHAPDFYERLSVRDRIAVDALSKWLRPVGWQWFVTLTFPWNVKSETAVHKLRQLIDGLERHHRARVCVVAGQESKPRQHGMSVPTHFHLLLASHVRLSAEAVKALWFAQVTRCSSQDRDDESILIKSYQAHQRGPEYCLKAINDSYGDWFIHRLEDFLPGAPGPGKPNHQSVRSAKRNMQQLARLATTSAPASLPKMP